MAKNRSYKRYITRTKKYIRSQILHKPSMYSSDTYVSDWSPFYFTENKIVQSLSRLMFWDDVKKRWLLGRCDSNGYLITKPWSLEKEAADFSLFTDVPVGSKELITHSGIDVSGYSKKQLIVSTTGTCSVYVQFSNDNVNWFSWYDVQDVGMVWTCDSNKKSWEIIDHTHYLRIIIYNSSASSVTVSASLMCQV